MFNKSVNEVNENAAMNEMNQAADNKAAEKISRKFHLVRSDEKIMASLNNSRGLNMMLGRGNKTGDAVITNRRLYYNYKEGFILSRTKEQKINLKDITGTQIQGNDNFGKLIKAIGVLILGLVAMAAVHPFVGLILAAVGGVMFLNYKLTREKYLEINYAGGVIRFPVVSYGMDNIRAFQNMIYRMTDEAA